MNNENKYNLKKGDVLKFGFMNIRNDYTIANLEIAEITDKSIFSPSKSGRLGRQSINTVNKYLDKSLVIVKNGVTIRKYTENNLAEINKQFSNDLDTFEHSQKEF